MVGSKPKNSAIFSEVCKREKRMATRVKKSSQWCMFNSFSLQLQFLCSEICNHCKRVMCVLHACSLILQVCTCLKFHKLASQLASQLKALQLHAWQNKVHFIATSTACITHAVKERMLSITRKRYTEIIRNNSR